MAASKHEYTAEFKEEAVRLLIIGHKSCAEIVRNLGIPHYLVVRWKQQHEQKVAESRRSMSRKHGSRSSKLSVRNAIFGKLLWFFSRGTIKKRCPRLDLRYGKHR